MMEDQNIVPETENTVLNPQPPMSLISKMLGVFTDPKKTYTALAAKPDYLIPLILVVLASFVFTLIALPVIQKDTAEISRQRMLDRGMTQEQIDTFSAQQEKIGKISALAGAPFSTVAITIVASALLLFAGNIIMGGDAKYAQMLCVYSYASLIGLIGYAVRTVLIMAKGTILVYTSLAALFPPEMKNDLIFKIAGIFDIFVIWKIIVIGIGMGVMFKVDTKKPLLIVAAMYLLFALATALLTPKF